jgi:LacI family transcriptional regulator
MEREEINLNSMYLHRVSGIIASVSQTTVSSNHFKRLIDQGVKIVFFDRVCDDLDVSKVTIDDFGSAYRLTGFLLERGYKRIVHFAGPSNLSICRKRSEGYIQALKDYGNGLKPLIFEGGMSENDGYINAEKMLNEGITECAVLAVNDPVAVGALKKIKEQNIDIPGKIGIAGFSNNPITEIITPSLTTIDQSALEMGRKAAEILIDEIENTVTGISPVNIILETNIIVRDSVKENKNL